MRFSCLILGLGAGSEDASMGAWISLHARQLVEMCGDVVTASPGLDALRSVVASLETGADGALEELRYGGNASARAGWALTCRERLCVQGNTRTGR